MRPSLRPAALAALLLLGAGTLAQQAFADAPTPDTPPASSAAPSSRPATSPMPSTRLAPPPPIAAAGPGRAAPPPPPVADASIGAAMPVLTGRVQRWLVNPNGEVDGLLLADGTQVAFPPHLSASAQRLLQPGDGVRVTGWRAPDAQVVRASSLTATASGRSLSDTPPAADVRPPAPREPGALTAMSGSGRIARQLRTDRGDVNGVILEDGLIVRFPPHVGIAQAALLQPGATVAAKGWGSRGPQGGAFEATAIGATAADLREVFAGPGRAPGGPGAGGRPGAPGAPGASGAPGRPGAPAAPVAPPTGS
jgi:hypothetical protein